MSWNRGQPADNSLLRNLGLLVRNNFQAIDSADATLRSVGFNYADRDTSPLAGTSDPTAIADTYIQYCKQDSSGNPELYTINENSDVIQFTRGAPTLATQGKLFLPGGLLLQWDTLVVTSEVAVNFLEAFGVAPYICHVQPWSQTNNGENRIFYRLTAAPTTTSFTAQILNNNGDARSATMNYFAVGEPT